jgi:serine/threonine protein kinase
VLNVLDMCHRNGFVHCAVLPEHILIEPRDHKLVLIDWCFSMPLRPWNQPLKDVAIGPMKKWYRWNYRARSVSPALDISLGADCMVYLLNGKGESIQIPNSLDPALQRHFERCMYMPDGQAPQAHQLLGQFDQLIEALWGPREFRPLTLPPR